MREAADHRSPFPAQPRLIVGGDLVGGLQAIDKHYTFGCGAFSMSADLPARREPLGESVGRPSLARLAPLVP